MAVCVHHGFNRIDDVQRIGLGLLWKCLSHYPNFSCAYTSEKNLGWWDIERPVQVLNSKQFTSDLELGGQWDNIQPLEGQQPIVYGLTVNEHNVKRLQVLDGLVHSDTGAWNTYWTWPFGRDIPWQLTRPKTKHPLDWSHWKACGRPQGNLQPVK